MNKTETPMCAASTLKGKPCQNRGTVPLDDGSHLCGAHASAGLAGKLTTDRGGKPVSKRAAAKTVKLPEVTAAPPTNRERTRAERSFSPKTVARQLARLARRDANREPKPHNAPSRYARALDPLAVN